MRRPKRYAYRGRLLTNAELADLAGVTAFAMRSRLNGSGMTVEQAVNHQYGTRRRYGMVPRTFEFRGQQMTKKQIAKILGRGVSWVDANIDGNKVREPRPNPYGDLATHGHWPTYTFNGITDTMTGWARRAGMRKHTLQQRIRSGWPIERALTEPVAGIDQRTRKRNRRTIRRIVATCRALSPASMLTFEGTKQPIEEWALDYGITSAVIIARLERGETIEHAITTPMPTAPGQRLHDRGVSSNFPQSVGTGVGRQETAFDQIN